MPVVPDRHRCLWFEGVWLPVVPGSVAACGSRKCRCLWFPVVSGDPETQVT